LSTNVIFSIVDLIRKCLEEVKKNELIEDLSKHEELVMAMLKKSAQTELDLITAMTPLVDNKSVEEVEQQLSSSIGQYRVKLIKKAAGFETYQMKVVNKSTSLSSVQIHRSGAEFMPEIILNNPSDLERASWFQIASLVVELFILALSAVGVGIDLSEATIRKITRDAVVIVQRCAFDVAINKFAVQWNRGGVWTRAKAIFYFLKDSHSAGIFWKIVKLCIKDMSWWDETRTVLELTGMVVAAFFTDGAALIARFALAVDDAVYVGQKIGNLMAFENMKPTLK
jgi:hypothetical protein